MGLTPGRNLANLGHTSYHLPWKLRHLPGYFANIQGEKERQGAWMPCLTENCCDPETANPRSYPFNIGLPDPLEGWPPGSQKRLQLFHVPVNGLPVQVLVYPPENPQVIAQIKIHLS